MEQTHPASVEVSRDGSTITIHVPLTFRRRGGRKLIISPPGHEPWAPTRSAVDEPLVKALVRAFRWKDLLTRGEFVTVTELAKAERMNPSYVAHVLRLTLLAPDIVEAILDGRQPRTMQLQPLLRKDFPASWEQQRAFFA